MSSFKLKNYLQTTINQQQRNGINKSKSFNDSKKSLSLTLWKQLSYKEKKVQKICIILRGIKKKYELF